VNPKVLLTGHPGCGKTTLVKRVVKDLPQKTAGFYTEEIRERGTRVGFRLVTLDGHEGVLAHVGFKSPERMGKYRLDLAALETVGVEAIREAMRTGQVIVIDEIGPMEIRSEMFRRAIQDALDSGAPVLATITARSTPFTDSIKSRPDVSIVQVHLANREMLASNLREKFRTSD
jgi:nucleoside-triphosphatase